jgi:hypothetical protein
MKNNSDQKYTESNDKKNTSAEFLKLLREQLELDFEIDEAMLEEILRDNPEINIEEIIDLHEEKGLFRKMKASILKFLSKYRNLLQLLIFTQFVAQLLVNQARVALGQQRSASLPGKQRVFKKNDKKRDRKKRDRRSRRSRRRGKKD